MGHLGRKLSNSRRPVRTRLGSLRDFRRSLVIFNRLQVQTGERSTKPTRPTAGAGPLVQRIPAVQPSPLPLDEGHYRHSNDATRVELPPWPCLI